MTLKTKDAEKYGIAKRQLNKLKKQIREG